MLGLSLSCSFLYIDDSNSSLLGPLTRGGGGLLSHVDFKKCSCRPVDFRKINGHVALSNLRNACIALSQSERSKLIDWKLQI